MDTEKFIAAHLDDSLNDSERDELTAWLRADPGNLGTFTEAVMLDQQIREAVQAESLRGSAVTFVVAESEVAARGAHRWRNWLALAACLTLLAAAGFWFQRQSAQSWVAKIALTRGAIAADAAV
ncbi:MAG: hypothetical protein ABI680_15505, partial [Chthoniobacteraceae bacterium]